jgi:hypothetical protein
MKKIILFGLFLSLMGSVAEAQRTGSKFADRLESYQVAFITQKLDLSAEEAQKFWPLYNQYRDQTRKLRQEGSRTSFSEDMSDVEAEQYIKSSLDREGRELDLRKEFIQKLRGALPPRKIAKLQDLDREFKKELLERARERKMNKGN